MVKGPTNAIDAMEQEDMAAEIGVLYFILGCICLMRSAESMCECHGLLCLGGSLLLYFVSIIINENLNLVDQKKKFMF